MKNTTKQMSADACVLSVRTRPAGPVFRADTRTAQGTTLSVVTDGAILSVSMALVATVAPVSGVVSAMTFAYKTSDVVRSPSGRPPV